MRILTLSTLYNKGGAAYIAKTLNDGFIKSNHQAKYLIGYGSNGVAQKQNNPNLIYAKYDGLIYPHLNFLSHQLIGKDLFSPQKSQLIELLDWSEVLICHTLHSHFLNFDVFFNLLIENYSGKKVIFVAHDSWHYTGRCAFIYECEGWKSSCQNCKHTNFYPSSVFSITEREWSKKIKLIAKIPNLTFISPAQWICDDLKEVYPQSDIQLIRNGLDLTPYANTTILLKENKEIQFCVSSLDLSQRGKVDISLVKSILDQGYKVHFIGKNNPFKNHPNSICHGYVTDKSKYIEILQSVDCYLFSSSIDIYPTVLIEAICAGKFILYTKSKGASEIMESENSWWGASVENVEDIVTEISSSYFIDKCNDIDYRNQITNTALKFYNKDRMVEEYLRLIET